MDRNKLCRAHFKPFFSRTPQECVDRNSHAPDQLPVNTVALHRSAWIEINNKIAMRKASSVALHRSAWIEIDPTDLAETSSVVALHRSAWIEIKQADLGISIQLSHSTGVRG